MVVGSQAFGGDGRRDENLALVRHPFGCFPQSATAHSRYEKELLSQFEGNGLSPAALMGRLMNSLRGRWAVGQVSPPKWPAPVA